MSDLSKGRDEKYGRIGDVHLAEVPDIDQCYPGIEPTEYNVLLAPAEMPKKIGSIIIADETRDQLAMAKQVGRIVAISPVAFNYERWPDGVTPPKLGDIVWFARYAGGLVDGVDGREYRIVKDKDIGAVIPPLDHQRLAKVKALGATNTAKAA